LSFPVQKEICKASIFRSNEEIYDEIKIILKAEVPFSANLSEGLDSSVTTSYIKQIYSEVLHNYSIGLYDKAFDETSFQIEVAFFFKPKSPFLLMHSTSK